MVEVRCSRVSQEALADEGLSGAVTRVDVQAAGAFDATTGEVQCSRVAFEVLATDPLTASTTRVDVHVASAFDATTGETQCSRVAFEVLASSGDGASNTRLDVQAAGAFDAPVEAQCSRLACEVLARQGSTGLVTPLPLMDDVNILLLNWATKASMESSFRNSVEIAPSDGVESRRGLTNKPTRNMKLEWMVCAGSTELDQLERLEVFLRRMTDERFQVPIYMDQQELDADYVASATVIQVPTREARFFQGARIAVVQLDANYQPASFEFYFIADLTNDQIELTTSLGVDTAAGSLVFPMIDCEIALEVEADYSTARVPSVKVTVSEVSGESQLPALKSDTPTDAETYDDIPIWYEEPDWSNGITKGRSRQGQRYNSGRTFQVATEAGRSRQTHEYALSGKREDMWKVLEFFETRRGRLRSFWHIDQDQYMETVSIDPSGQFAGVSEVGDLADFQEEFEHVGIIMNDGSVFVRGVVTIQQVLTVFRITMDMPIDSGLSVADVARLARARLTRFTADAFTEVWFHTGYMTCNVSFIEVLNEGDYPTT